MMCEDTADMMLSKESPSVRLLMKRTLRELIAKPKLPANYLEALKALVISEEEKQKALAQAQYQQQALVTSQTRNTLKTKENKKLQAKLRGYDDNYASILQYLVREKIKINKSVKNITIEVKKQADKVESTYIKRVLGNDKFASICFELTFLDSIREELELCAELVNQDQPLVNVFESKGV